MSIPLYALIKKKKIKNSNALLYLGASLLCLQNNQHLEADIFQSSLLLRTFPSTHFSLGQPGSSGNFIFKIPHLQVDSKHDYQSPSKIARHCATAAVCMYMHNLSVKMFVYAYSTTQERKMPLIRLSTFTESLQTITEVCGVWRCFMGDLLEQS